MLKSVVLVIDQDMGDADSSLNIFSLSDGIFQTLLSLLIKTLELISSAVKQGTRARHTINR